MCHDATPPRSAWWKEKHPPFGFCPLRPALLVGTTHRFRARLALLSARASPSRASRGALSSFISPGPPPRLSSVSSSPEPPSFYGTVQTYTRRVGTSRSDRQTPLGTYALVGGPGAETAPVRCPEGYICNRFLRTPLLNPDRPYPYLSAMWHALDNRLREREAGRGAQKRVLFLNTRENGFTSSDVLYCMGLWHLLPHEIRREQTPQQGSALATDYD